MSICIPPILSFFLYSWGQNWHRMGVKMGITGNMKKYLRQAVFCRRIVELFVSGDLSDGFEIILPRFVVNLLESVL